MTTNVYDATACMMTSDSRWSILGAEFVAYVDDSGFDKLHAFEWDGNSYCAMFAGSAQLISEWKFWINDASNGNIKPKPDVERDEQTITICIVSANENMVIFERGQDIVLDNARFAGTGAFGAHECWRLNKCAIKAVNTAKTVDEYSGGETKYVDLLKKVSNINESCEIKKITDSLLNKGMIMYKASSGTPLPIAEAAANDSNVRKLMDDVASGKAVASAPCDSMYNKWTDDEKKNLYSVLDGIFK